MIAVILVILLFQKSENLGAAYGMAVTGAMTVTAIMMVLVFYYRKNIGLLLAACFVMVVDLFYAASTITKIPHGAYWSLILAAIPFTTIVIWTRGQSLLFKSLRPLDLETFLMSYEQVYAKGRLIEGTAVFLRVPGKSFPPMYPTACSAVILFMKRIFSSVSTAPILLLGSKLIISRGSGLVSMFWRSMRGTWSG